MKGGGLVMNQKTTSHVAPAIAVKATQFEIKAPHKSNCVGPGAKASPVHAQDRAIITKKEQGSAY